MQLPVYQLNHYRRLQTEFAAVLFKGDIEELLMIVSPGGGPGGVVVDSASQLEGRRFKSTGWPGLHVLPVFAWVLPRYSGFLIPSKDMHIGLNGDFKVVHRCECEHAAWLFVVVDRLVTCPVCTLPFAQ